MEWLKEIRQTFTSTYDSQANGVAEWWINLIKTKAMVLLASKVHHTSCWCYAVAWVARLSIEASQKRRITGSSGVRRCEKWREEKDPKGQTKRDKRSQIRSFFLQIFADFC